MCFGGRSNRENNLTISGSTEKKRSSSQSLLSNPRSTAAKSCMTNSALSHTGVNTQTGGPSKHSNRPVAKEDEPLPVEVTAKSPKKGSVESGRAQTSRNRKNSGQNDDGKSSKYEEDDPTLRNEKEAEGGMVAETTEERKSEWSIMGKGPSRNKKEEKEAARRALHTPRAPPVVPPPPPPPPPLPTQSVACLPPTPPIPCYTPPPVPSPSVTPPVCTQPVSSCEKTAQTTIRTQRTLMEEETLSKHHTLPSIKNQKDVSYEMDTKVINVSVPLKISLREDLRQDETPLPSPDSKKKDIHGRSITVEIPQTK